LPGHGTGPHSQGTRRIGECGVGTLSIDGDNGAPTESSIRGSTNAMGAFANGATESQAWLLQLLDGGPPLTNISSGPPAGPGGPLTGGGRRLLARSSATQANLRHHRADHLRRTTPAPPVVESTRTPPLFRLRRSAAGPAPPVWHGARGPCPSGARARQQRRRAVRSRRRH
jgi:hypothetical protein